MKSKLPFITLCNVGKFNYEKFHSLIHYFDVELNNSAFIFQQSRLRQVHLRRRGKKTLDWSAYQVLFDLNLFLFIILVPEAKVRLLSIKTNIKGTTTLQVIP